MSLERPEMRLVREKLESVLAPTMASSVLFDALAEVGGRPPGNGEATLALVEGPLARVLARRVRGLDGDAIIEELIETLRVVVKPVATPATPELRARFRELDATLEVTPTEGAVPVLVLAGNDNLAMRLEAVLGPGRIATRTLYTRGELIGQLKSSSTPQIVLIDATEVPAIEPVDLAALLSGTRPGTVHAIWGADLAYGAAALTQLVEQKVPATPIDRKEGIEPFVDLVRSRRA
jgi:hypothetical protein